MGYSVSHSSSLNATTFLLMTRKLSKYNSCLLYFISAKGKAMAKKAPLLRIKYLTWWTDCSLLLVQYKSGGESTKIIGVTSVKSSAMTEHQICNVKLLESRRIRDWSWCWRDFTWGYVTRNYNGLQWGIEVTFKFSDQRFMAKKILYASSSRKKEQNNFQTLNGLK